MSDGYAMTDNALDPGNSPERIKTKLSDLTIEVERERYFDDVDNKRARGVSTKDTSTGIPRKANSNPAAAAVAYFLEEIPNTNVQSN